MKDGLKLEKVIAENGRFAGFLKLQPFRGAMGYTGVYLSAKELRELAAMALAVAHELEADGRGGGAPLLQAEGVARMTNRPLSERVPCPVCGFAVGDRVEMLSGFLLPRFVHGVVVQWTQCGHIIEWDGSPYTDTGTALPNPNVRLEKEDPR